MPTGCFLLPLGFIPSADEQGFLSLSNLFPRTISVMMPYTLSLVLSILHISSPSPLQQNWGKNLPEADVIPGIHM